ncbi:dipeptide/oligopeptide/nickel ABC transporter ATP-binding protein [Arthrobacter sp. MYb23]|uniref:ABC transporter ATP-binding protein n=1 Tax=unclassified Arthrobacter TaxID=235627 RepID=UPI000CFD6297|nr:MULTISPECIES: ABC transporter ATP-binding protein [unclassified Arthrobacter]PRB41022.1 dipeptide/oligopeptide/nickel ABC transporter ATP-binding protein [Arthrobacter sp. MYb51]PRB94692.1 dipeptide/oligopeptide/nickel ABC transporter ATP-binding protein [Arthrobacter sp. MYb23]
MTNVLSLEKIVKTFPHHKRVFTAVDDVSLRIKEGTVYGLVGESGSGKSTLARCAMQLMRPTSGRTIFEGDDLGKLTPRALRNVRSRMGMVLQNPVASLNPRMTIGASVAEPLRAHTTLKGQALQSKIEDLLDEVGLGAGHAHRLPHQLSGGQCQRVGIARALATSPRLLILDEPTSALDVSVQAQILNLLQDLQQQKGLTYLLISHDLDVVRYLSDEVAVMKSGKIVESGAAERIFTDPQHDYTRTLLEAAPGHKASPAVGSHTLSAPNTQGSN